MPSSWSAKRCDKMLHMSAYLWASPPPKNPTATAQFLPTAAAAAADVYIVELFVRFGVVERGGVVVQSGPVEFVCKQCAAHRPSVVSDADIILYSLYVCVYMQKYSTYINIRMCNST